MPRPKVQRAATVLVASAAARLIAAAIVVLLGAVALGLGLGHGSVQPALAVAGDRALLRVATNGGGPFPIAGGAVQVQGPREAQTTCEQNFYPVDRPCDYNGFLEGETVTLTASAIAPAVFKGWSDDRCPAGPVCNLVLADEQMVVALFSPLPITVTPRGIFGSSTVKITDGAGNTCLAIDNGNQQSCSFDLYSQLTLVASANTPQWNPTDCEIVPSGNPDISTCTATVLGRQQFNIGFGEPAADDAPPKVAVIFRARKTGLGAGTIGGRLDCGSRCSVTVPFRETVTLAAAAAAGSRFVGWSGGCGTAATCTLQATGTSVAAEFETLPDTVAKAPTSSLTPPPPGRFQALVGPIATTGKRGRRQIQIVLAVNAPAGVRIALFKHGRRLKGRLFSVPKGISRVSFGVPARVGAGRYRLKLKFRDRAGSPAVRVARTTRLPR